MQADTVMREAANVLTMDGADRLEAMLYAATHSSGLPTLGMSYQQARREQAQRGAYDRQHRQGAVFAGQGLGYGLAARAGGGPGSLQAQKFVNSLSKDAKGLVGEVFSAAKTLSKSDIPVRAQTEVRLGGKRYTIIDHATKFGNDIVEAKYRSGRFEGLKGSQKLARQMFGPKDRLDVWGPEHVGRVGGILGGGGAVSAEAGYQSQK